MHPANAEIVEKRVPFEGDGADLYEALEALPGAVLLEDGAAPAGEGWSLVAVDPWAVLTVRSAAASIVYRDGTSTRADDPFAAMRILLAAAPDEDPPSDVPFAGGLLGYLGYDMRLAVERLPDENPPDCTLPDAWLGAYDIVVFLAAGGGEARVLGHVRPGASADELAARVRAVTVRLGASVPAPAEDVVPTGRVAVSSLRRAAYEQRVEHVREYIRAGDVYQVNLTQRFLVATDETPLAIYRRLRRDHAARYQALLRVGDAAVVSFSPEQFLRVEGRAVESRPIKGTIARSVDPDEDVRRAQVLASSEKDRAELTMIVDLVRNDLSRVCAAGTVEVNDHAHVESAPTVHHLVTSVTGTIDEGHDAIDLLRAAMPGGSITGAPKVRAMEIIDELETTRRGVYTGAIGFIGVDGRCELSIAIRTLVMEDGWARVHGGGGIVIDSDPAGEYDESVVKVKGLLDAFGAEVST